MSSINTIPKKIFYVWGANERKPRDVLACIQSWRQNCADYEIIEINEQSTEYFNYQKELKDNSWFRAVHQMKMWAYVADYVRIKTLYDNGGIYLDTDVTCIKNFDEFLNLPAFVGMQSEKYVEPAILGAVKCNALLKKILNYYQNDVQYESPTTMPEIFERFLNYFGIERFPAKNDQKVISLQDVTIFPERFFIPFRYGDEFKPSDVEPDTVTIHWFGGSWLREEVFYFLQNKSKFSLQMGEIKKVETERHSLFKCLPIVSVTKTNRETKVKVLGIPCFSYSRDKFIAFGIKLISIKRL